MTNNERLIFKFFLSFLVIAINFFLYTKINHKQAHYMKEITMMVLTSNYRKRIFNFKHREVGSIKLEDVEVE